MTNTRLILHVKGTEDQTTELPKQIVRAAISQGQITHSQLIWSPSHNAWKQVRELPHLLPSQKLAPAPPPRAGTVPLPQIAAAPDIGGATIPRVARATGAVPRIAGSTGPIPKVAGSTGAVPRVAAVPAAATVVPARRAVAKGPSTDHVVAEEGQGFHPMKWLCIVVGVLIVLAVVVNYFLVDRPLVSRFSQTSYAKVGIFGHLGAFMQPNVLIIHIPASPAITSANMADFLVTLARSTPTAPMSDNLYERVALTSGWMGQYSFSGFAWKRLGDMTQDDEATRKEAILADISDAGGNPLASPNSTLNEDAQQAQRDKVWADLVAHFAANPGN